MLAADRLEPGMRTWCQWPAGVGAVSEGKLMTGPWKGGGGVGEGWGRRGDVTPPATPILHLGQGLGGVGWEWSPLPTRFPSAAAAKCHLPPPPKNTQLG